jgi:hypothetical protein
VDKYGKNGEFFNLTTCETTFFAINFMTAMTVFLVLKIKTGLKPVKPGHFIFLPQRTQSARRKKDNSASSHLRGENAPGHSPRMRGICL